MNVSILLLASGRGTRLGADVPKAYLRVRGRALVLRSLDRLRRAAPAADVVLAIHPADRDSHVAAIRGELERAGVRAIVDGGPTRQASMRRAFSASDPDTDLILIHDAARPFPPIDAVRDALSRAREVGAALLAVRAADTLKLVDERGTVRETIDRGPIWLAQTPQVIRRDRLEQALARADADGFEGTDDVSLCENAGIPVVVVVGDRRNLKVTTPDDLVVAEALAELEDSR